MKHRHARARGIAAIGVATGVAATGLVVASATQNAATAAPTGSAVRLPTSPQANAARVAHSLAGTLGARSAGSYIDQATGRLVVTVTDGRAAGAVRAAGARPRTVERGGDDLKEVMAELERDATVPGTAWAVDPAANQVVLSMDATVTGDRLRKVRAAAAEHGAAVRTARVEGRFRTFTAGGQAIYAGGGRCSLGFNVRRAGTYYFLTAGHCTDIGSSWFADRGGSRRLGDTAAGSFPGNDYGIVRYSGTPADTRGTVYLYGGSRDITGAGSATVGQTVVRSGSTTGVHQGRVTALNQTVNYAEGSVSGLIRTTVCAEPGDSGGPLLAGSTALGLTSGGSGNCTFGGTTFFQPVTEALNRYGVQVY